MKNSPNQIVIAGAGIAGCYAALLFAKKGYKVTLVEKYSKKDMIDNNSKRTFNITIYGYGLTLFKKATIWKELLQHVVPLKGSVTQIGNLSEPIVAANPTHSYFAVKRASILKELLSALAKHKNITTRFESELTDFDFSKKIATIVSGGKKQKLGYELLIGADGAHSVARGQLLKQKGSTLKQEYSKYFYKQISLTKGDVKRLNLNPTYAYTWTRKDSVIATFPNKNESITAILILPKTQLLSLNSEQPISKFVMKTYPSLIPALKSISKSLIQNPAGSFLTLTTDPWVLTDSVALVGDSAHAFNPFFGQGVSAALGDVNALVEFYSNNSDKLGALRMYQEKRKPNMDTMGRLSQEGIKAYMRTSRADKNAIYGKFEDILHKIFPKFIMPSIFNAIVDDPENTFYYAQKHRKQRMLGRIIGFELLVEITASIVSLIEKRQLSNTLTRI